MGISIAKVEVSREKNTRYNVEMQALSVEAITKRARYYHARIGMETLLSGIYYDELPDTYVIFVCDFDLFGLKKYRYTQKKICEEYPEFEIDDGAHTLFLSTKGENETEVPKELVNFLKYVSAPLEQSEADFDDDYVRKLQKAVKEIKQSGKWGQGICHSKSI